MASVQGMRAVRVFEAKLMRRSNPGRRLHDAVVIVPGIMGSELREAGTGRKLWGVGKLLTYTARAHTDRLRQLAVTEDEREGRTGRVEVTGLLESFELLPGLGSAHPYTAMVAEMRRSVVDPAALLPFPYDWRLSVEHNGALLAAAARRHLDAWRAHPGHRGYLEANPEAGPARLVVVAHSMGGLLTREALHLDPALRGDIRAVMTVGTPFNGSVKAVLMLNAGKGLPFPVPPAVLRQVAATMPGLYDLLPGYRAFEADGDMRVPGVEDIVALGGRRELAKAAVDWRISRAETTLPEHVTVVGMGQRTWTSYRLADGVALFDRCLFKRYNDGRLLPDAEGRPQRDPRTGDGTVYQYAAQLPGTERPVHFYHEHGALIRTRSVLDMASGLMHGLRHPEERGAMLGDEAEFELCAPEWAALGEPFAIEVDGVARGADLECRVRGVDGLDELLTPALRPVPGRAGVLAASCTPDRPGMYEVEVTGGEEPKRRLVPVLDMVHDG
ncbi:MULTISPECIES: lipase/acyltransferase domain-containing protein [unclassified Streptomyces]|uniref:lipase/acyltransferase domain-containing protein n=1 Tax=unclassified Streptomyces TaxID=2593676 RepID=UPI00332E7CC3